MSYFITIFTPNQGNVCSLSNDLKFPSGNGFYPDEKDGMAGYNTDPARGADTFHPFRGKVTLSFKLGNTPPNIAGGSREVIAGIINSSDYQKAVVKLSSHSPISNSLTLRVGDLSYPITGSNNAQEFDISNSKGKTVEVVLIIPAQSSINATGTVEFL